MPAFTTTTVRGLTALTRSTSSSCRPGSAACPGRSPRSRWSPRSRPRPPRPRPPRPPATACVQGRLLVGRGHDAEPDRERALGQRRRQEIQPDLGGLPGGQLDRAGDLTRPGHRLHRVGRDRGVTCGGHRAVHGQREPADAGRADHVRPGGLRAVAGQQRDRAVLAPADAGRQAVAPPGEHRRVPVLGAEQRAVRGAELQPDARLAGHRVGQRPGRRLRHGLPGVAARGDGDRGLAGQGRAAAPRPGPR